MSLLTRLVPNVFNPIQQTLKSVMGAPTIGMKALAEGTTAQPGGLFSVTIRNKIRVYFPRPSERKRIIRHGYRKRMSNWEGQMIMMKRILKGRFVLSH